MKLSSYMEILEDLTQLHRAEGDIDDAVAKPMPDGTSSTRQDYEWTIKALHESVRKNKALLGIFPENGARVPASDELRNAEISEKDLRLHIAKVRADLGALIAAAPDRKRENVAIRLLQKLSTSVRIKDLGEVFGKEEAAVVKAAQKKDEPCETQPDSKWDSNKDRRLSPEAEMDAYMTQLRRAGKIK